MNINFYCLINVDISINLMLVIKYMIVLLRIILIHAYNKKDNSLCLYIEYICKIIVLWTDDVK